MAQEHSPSNGGCLASYEQITGNFSAEVQEEIRALCEKLRTPEAWQAQLVGFSFSRLDHLTGSQQWRQTMAPHISGEQWQTMLRLGIEKSANKPASSCSTILDKAAMYYELPLSDLRSKNLKEIFAWNGATNETYGQWLGTSVPRPGDVAACLPRRGDQVSSTSRY